MSFSAIFVLKEIGTQSHSAKHVNTVPDLAASPRWVQHISQVPNIIH